MPDELTAGIDQPISFDELTALMNRHATGLAGAEEEARQLRQRIAKGRQILQEADPAEVDVDDARQQLEELSEALKDLEWQLMLSSGLSLAYALHRSVREISSREGWQPPQGSFARVRLPGILSVNMNLHDAAASS